MNRGKSIVLFILILIPALAALVLLALVNVLYFLLGLIVLLCCLVVLKKQRPELFAWTRRHAKPDPDPIRPSVMPEPPAKKTYLILAEQGVHDGSRITVDKPLYYIGRSENSDFVMNDPRIGRRHLRIQYSAADGLCYAVDLGSVNGTYLNSVRMTEGEPYRLVQGDRIMIHDRPFDVEYAHY